MRIVELRCTVLRGIAGSGEMSKFVKGAWVEDESPPAHALVLEFRDSELPNRDKEIFDYLKFLMDGIVHYDTQFDEGIRELQRELRSAGIMIAILGTITILLIVITLGVLLMLRAG